MGRIKSLSFYLNLYPGSCHDSTLANSSGFIYPKLSDSLTPPGYAILGDSAFLAYYRVVHGKIIRGRKRSEKRNISQSEELQEVDLVLQIIIPSERQSGEWDVRAIKAPFVWLLLPLPADSEKRNQILTIFVHLFNFQELLIRLKLVRNLYSGSQSQEWVACLN